jgi:hypothetical protein
MKTKHIIIVLGAVIAAAFFAGCAISYNGVDSTTIALDRVPKDTLAAALRSEPNASVQRVQIQTRRDTIVGYRFHFRGQNGNHFAAEFDPKGERVQNRK